MVPDQSVSDDSKVVLLHGRGDSGPNLGGLASVQVLTGAAENKLETYSVFLHRGPRACSTEFCNIEGILLNIVNKQFLELLNLPQTTSHILVAHETWTWFEAQQLAEKLPGTRLSRLVCCETNPFGSENS